MTVAFLDRVFLGPAVRGDEFRLSEDIETVFIVENEITFLAFPGHARVAVLLGGGYAVAGAARSAALADRRVYYWGDIDSPGSERVRSIGFASSS